MANGATFPSSAARCAASASTAELVACYAFETDDGAVIEIDNYGFRHGPPDIVAALARGEEVEPSAYYMRTMAKLETGDPRYP